MPRWKIDMRKYILTRKGPKEIQISLSKSIINEHLKDPIINSTNQNFKHCK